MTKLAEIALENIAHSYGVTGKGIDILRAVAESEPSRRVKASSRRGNRAVRYPSNKMGVVIQAESQSLEFASVLMKEFSKDVIKYYDQPPSLELVYLSGKRNVRTQSTLDYFVVAHSFIGYEEWKPFQELEKISKKRPDHIRFDDVSGRFISPAIERALDGTGLSYRINTEKDLNPILVANISFLDGYFRRNKNNQYQEEISELLGLIDKHPAMPLADIDSCGISRDAVFYGIASGDLYYPIADIDIRNHEEAIVFRDESKWLEINKITSHCEIDQDESLLENVPDKLIRTSPNQLENAARKLLQINRLASGEINISECADLLGASIRSIRRWRNAISTQKTKQEQLAALIPNTHNQGNRKPKLRQEILEKIDSIINEHFLSKKAISAHKVSLKVITWCQDNDIHPPSKTTVYEYINNHADHLKALKRQGAKAAYQYSAYQYDQVGVCTLDASYLMQRCHIDHTQLDIELVNEFGEPTGKPWITFAVDEFTGLILAFYISYRTPSYVSLMMIMRNIVKRHCCLPASVVVDGGKEFQGKDFEIFCATYFVSIFSREGQPRAGGAVERAFGSLNTQLIHNLDGNTKFMKNVRQVSRSHNPKLSAIWSMEKLAGAISSYLDIFNSSSAQKGTLSPEKLAKQSKSLYGIRNYLKQDYDDQFKFQSMPYIPRRTAKLTRGKPIVYDYHEYWHQSFSHAPKGGVKIDIKWDPENSEVVYAYYPKSWIVCRLSSRRNKSNLLDKAASAETTRMEAKINNRARKDSYLKISSSIDQIEETLMASKNQPIESKKNKADKNENLIDTEKYEEFSLFDLDIPESIEK